MLMLMLISRFPFSIFGAHSTILLLVLTVELVLGWGRRLACFLLIFVVVLLAGDDVQGA